MKKILLTALLLAYAGAMTAQAPVRGFMSHRGVHLNHTVAGENSLEAIDMAHRAGFWCIETDTRYTKDSVLVIMHDADIKRTCDYADGRSIKKKTAVANLTFNELRTQYRLKASREAFRTQVPTLKEYLQHCKKYGFLVFIEPKLNDSTGRYYQDIIREADEVLGRKGYVITSNNFANSVIRNTLGIKDVRLMGLLYKTDYETMAEMGNMIFAVSTTEFSPEVYAKNVAQAHGNGYWVQSAAGLFSKDATTDFDCFQRIGAEGKKINLIATDEIAPDYVKTGKMVAKFSATDTKTIAKKLAEIEKMELSGLYVDFTCQGKADFVIGTDSVAIGKEGNKFAAKYQKMFFDCVPNLSFENASADFKLLSCKVYVVKF